MSRLISVHWRDSGSVDGVVWQFKHDWTCDVHDCQSVGIEVENTKDKIVIAQSSNADQWGRLFAIPKENVISVKELEQSK